MHADDRAYFIMFYVPWCRGCKRMAEQWDALADAFSADRRVVLAKFDCMQDEDFCAEREGIDHTPTLKLYHRGKVGGAECGHGSVAWDWGATELVSLPVCSLLT